MTNKFVYTLGRYGKSNGKGFALGQIFLLVVSFPFLLLSIVLTVIDLKNIQFVFAWILFYLLLLFIFSKIYHIEYDANWFYLKRLFYKTQKICVDNFVEVRRSMFFTAHVYFVFKDKRVLTQGYTKNAFKFLFMPSNEEYNKKYTAEVKINIEKAKKEKEENQGNGKGYHRNISKGVLQYG